MQVIAPKVTQKLMIKLGTAVANMVSCREAIFPMRLNFSSKSGPNAFRSRYKPYIAGSVVSKLRTTM